LVSSCSPRVALSHGTCESEIRISSEKIFELKGNTIESTQFVVNKTVQLEPNLRKLLHMDWFKECSEVLTPLIDKKNACRKERCKIIFHL